MQKLKCKICNKLYSHLGSHIFHAHGILAREYKQEFGLPYKMSLITNDIKKKKQDAFEEDREKYVKNLLKSGKKYQFKKGRTGQRRISEHERKTIIARINDVNKKRKPGNCPVCRMGFKNVDSHLYQVHKFINVKNL